MAGPWIKMSCDLDTNPHVIEIASVLNTTEIHVVGMLWKVWSWADAHSIDGNAIRVTSVTLDRFTGVTGFAAAMRQTGWLEGEDGCLSFPRFAEHNGETAKKRAETAKRVAKHRNASRVTDVTLLALPEKRREEENTDTGTGAETDAEADFGNDPGLMLKNAHPNGRETNPAKPKRIQAAEASTAPLNNRDALAAIRIEPARVCGGTLKEIPDVIDSRAVADWWRGHISGDPLTGDTALDLLHVLCAASEARKTKQVKNRAAKLASLLSSGEWIRSVVDLEANYEFVRRHVTQWKLSA